MTPLRTTALSVVPSPYQRDLYAALAALTTIRLQVFYLEAASPDSPWPEKPLAPFERILPGRWLPLGSARIHTNPLSAPLRDALARSDAFILNTLVSATAQRLLRGPLRRPGVRWFFWGERLKPHTGIRGKVHSLLTAPLRRATGIAAIGKLALEDYRRRFPDTPAANIPYHTDLSPFLDAKPDRDPASITFLFCGQMIARKGLDLLLAAFADIAQRHPAARLLLVGREADLPTFLAPLDPALRARIEYGGFIAPDALAPSFARADAFVLPSRHDGWGVVVNQAIGAGLPIVCSDAVGAAHDLVRHGTNGFLFPSGDREALARALDTLAGNPDLRARFGAASRSLAGDWTPERGAAKWESFLRDAPVRYTPPH